MTDQPNPGLAALIANPGTSFTFHGRTSMTDIDDFIEKTRAAAEAELSTVHLDTAAGRAEKARMIESAVKSCLTARLDRRERIAVAVLPGIIARDGTDPMVPNVRDAFKYADLVIAETDKEAS